MRNRYSPPQSRVSDGPAPSRRVRMFWLCAVSGTVIAAALLVSILLAFGEKTVRASLGVAACSLITLGGTIALSYLVSGLE